jgi:hypothetical protein
VYYYYSEWLDAIIAEAMIGFSPATTLQFGGALVAITGKSLGERSKFL